MCSLIWSSGSFCGRHVVALTDAFEYDLLLLLSSFAQEQLYHLLTALSLLLFLLSYRLDCLHEKKDPPVRVQRPKQRLLDTPSEKLIQTLYVVSPLHWPTEPNEI